MAKYHISIIIIHWLMSILIISIIGIGLFMTSIADDYPNKWDYYALHKSLGVCALVFIVIRIITRLLTKAPEADSKIGKMYVILSKCTIFSLYVMMFLIPFSGYCMSMIGGHGAMFFGIPVPNLLPQFILDQKDLGGLAYNTHIYGSYVMIALISLHLLGTIKHIFFDRINILKKIV